MRKNRANRPLVFLIEDDPDDQYMFNMIIKELGINIELQVFENGLVAFESLLAKLSIQESEQTKALPELILLDLNLPIWDGKKTLRRIKNEEDLKIIPVLIYTTSKSEYDMHDCYALGANSFISKAVEYDQIIVQLEQIFNYWFKVCSQ